MCLATDWCLTADPVVVSSIPARSHTFGEIDREIISTALPLNHSRRVFVSYKQKYVHKVLVSRLFKLAQKKVWLSELTSRHDHSCCLERKATKRKKGFDERIIYFYLRYTDTWNICMKLLFVSLIMLIYYPQSLANAGLLFREIWIWSGKCQGILLSIICGNPEMAPGISASHASQFKKNPA